MDQQITYMFNKEVTDKKQVARGSYSKKTHNGKAGCRMPSDSLSAREKAALNGPVVSYNLSKPMTWAEYKALPNDETRALYLTKLMRDYQARDPWLAKMLGVADVTVQRERTRLGVAGRGKGGRISQKTYDAWDAFVGMEKVQTEAEITPENVRKVDETPSENVRKAPDVSWEDLFAAAKLLGERYGVTVRVEVSA